MHTASHPLGYPVYDRAHGSWVVPWLFDRHHASHSRRAITVCDGYNGRRGISRRQTPPGHCCNSCASALRARRPTWRGYHSRMFRALLILTALIFFLDLAFGKFVIWLFKT